MTDIETETRPVRFAVVGLRHPHGEAISEALVDADAHLVSYLEDDDDLATEFASSFPSARRAESAEEIWLDQTVRLVVSAAVPKDRPDVAVAAMEHGKDVVLDKPACTNQEQLEAMRSAAARTGRHLVVWFDERIDDPTCSRAIQLIEQGAIGEVVHVIGTGPHELDLFPRPDWFYDPYLAGGILVDLGSQQIELFLALTGSDDVAVEFARAGNLAHPERESFQDVGDAVLRSGSGTMGYLRVDWLTPAGMGAYGDGRTFVVGTAGTLELRRVIDPAGRGEGHHLFVSDREGTRYIDAAGTEPTFARALLDDVRNRTQACMSTEHALRVMQLGLEAQALATATDRDRAAP